MRLSDAVVAYLIIGAVMWGGGVISWENSGMTTVMLSQTDAGIAPDASMSESVENINPTQGLLESLGGPLLIVWDLIIKFIGMLFWPVTVLLSVGAPPEVVVLGGGPFATAFIMGVIRLVRTSV